MRFMLNSMAVSPRFTVTVVDTNICNRHTHRPGVRRVLERERYCEKYIYVDITLQVCAYACTSVLAQTRATDNKPHVVSENRFRVQRIQIVTTRQSKNTLRYTHTHTLVCIFMFVCAEFTLTLTHTHIHNRFIHTHMRTPLQCGACAYTF